MKLRVLGAYGGTMPGCHMTCMLVNDQIVLDAGSLASTLTIEEQTQVRHVVLSHSHSDHVNSLPFFVENVFGRIEVPVQIHALPSVIEVVQRHLFNNAVWPDFASIPDRILPIMEFRPAPTLAAIMVGGLRVTLVPVNHVVPTVGLIVEDGESAIAVSGDTAPTRDLWEICNDLPLGKLKAILLETSFPNNRQALADISKHLTPRQLPAEIRKCRHDCPVYLYHLKPPFLAEIQAEIAALGEPRLHLLEQGRTYEL